MSRVEQILPPPPPPAREKLLRLLWRASGRKLSLDRFFTSLLKHRQCLPVVEARDCIPRFEESEVRLRKCPVGAWSTPIIDVYVLVKAVMGFNSKRVLELGSFRGDTARLIAENTPENVRIWDKKCRTAKACWRRLQRLQHFCHVPFAILVDRKHDE